MQMVTARRPSDAHKFALWSVAGSLGLFGVLRLGWTEAHLVLPLTRIQGEWALGMFGTPALPVVVTLECSGTDALALCVGAILAYPARWSARLVGAVGGISLIFLLNTLRIGSLGRAVASPPWFDVLHFYIWPAVLTLAITGYVFTWMRLAERPRGPLTNRPSSAPMATPRTLQPSRRFIGLTAVFLIAFAAASPLYLESAFVLTLGSMIAGAAAAILGAGGVGAEAAANVLSTPRGAFIVTQECISTPLVPVYLAAVVAYATTWRRLVAGVLATLPLFTALAIARLLVVALPAAVMASPTFLVHAFYQLLLAAVIVFIAARWRHSGNTAPAYAAAGAVTGVLFVFLLGPAYTHFITPPAGAVLADPQGAIAFLPAFQVGLYLALCVAALVAPHWTRVIAGFGLLALTQVGVLLALGALTAAGVTAHVRDVRAFAVVVPVVIFTLAARHVRAAH